jgi:succinate dehydrogenase / fumarate reductase membrane anchor subunit
MTDSLRTPLGQVRGRGSAKGGTGHFIAQRASGVALAVLAPWFAVSAALYMRGGFDYAHTFLEQPLAAVAAILLLLAMFYHARIGMQVVIEDYIHKPGAKAALALLNTFVAIAFAAAGVFAVLKISLGA